MRLSEWAATNGVHYQTAWLWARSGRMPVPVVQTPSGTWLVQEHNQEFTGLTVAYCRVSSTDQKDDLERQAGRVVLGPEELKDDLVRDMVDVLTSMCARLYGRRSARKRAEAGVACATAEAGGL
ncbi:hypothetical protein [Saccharopolyspora sp. NPDC050642]|uniref:recombinase family protein n=1 Tax=Saccharopolyspora sp. NPDC050642 TaxID=3157099 RepID=UPI0033F52A6F